MASNPGMLYVTMQTAPSLPLAEFHEWYNNEHGPTRLRLPQIFANGLRYAAIDGQQPHFLASYDVTSMHHLATPTYTTLRANRSPREAGVVAQIAISRYFYDLRAGKSSPAFKPIESLSDKEGEGQVLVAVEHTLKATDEGSQQTLESWYDEEYIPMVSKVPGWLRTRRFRTATDLADAGTALTYLHLHEFSRDNGLSVPSNDEPSLYGSSYQRTSRHTDIHNSIIDTTRHRTYALFYIFGPAPRDLHSLAQLPNEKAFTSSPDARIRTLPNNGQPILQAFVTTADGLSIPYQLEGNPDPAAPTVAFSNSLLTSYHMWDDFVAILKQHRPELRILRYNTRGRHAVPEPPVPATLDMLADDLATLLRGLRIEKLHALVGVSMGGATTLNFALKYPSLVGKFIACDFNVASSAANTEAWKERIAIAESVIQDGTSVTPGIRKLAGITVERWFHPHTMTAKPQVASAMTEMVGDNDVQGFRYGCQALWDYNLREEMAGCQVPGLLVVGDGDGKGALVKAMDGFKDGIGSGVELKIVPQAGHLPMFESPEAFWEAVQGFL